MSIGGFLESLGVGVENPHIVKRLRDVTTVGLGVGSGQLAIGLEGFVVSIGGFLNRCVLPSRSPTLLSVSAT